MKIQITTEKQNNAVKSDETSAETLNFELARCEETIQNGIGTFIEVGNALMNIREKRLYRKTYRNFTEYCLKRWNFGKSHANRLVLAAQATHELAPIGAISHESQIRPLLRLDPAKRQEAWREALKTNSTPTEWQVKAAVQKVTNGGLPIAKKSEIRHAKASLNGLRIMPSATDYDERCHAFLSLGIEEVRDLIDLSDWPDLRDAFLALRERLEQCRLLLNEGRREIA